MSAADSVCATLDDLADRWRRCTRTIIELCAFYQLDATAWLTIDTPELTLGITPVEARAVNGTRHVPRETPGALVTTKATRAARPTPALTGPPARILEALKAAGEPVSPGDLAKIVKLKPANLRYHLKALIASRAVVATGKTADRQLSLP